MCRRGDLNPHTVACTSPSSWRVCHFATPTWDNEVTATRLSDQQETQRNDGSDPNQTEHGGDAGEVALGGSATKRRRTGTTEHVAETTATTTVHEHTGHHSEEAEDVHDKRDVHDGVAHGLESYRARFKARR